jgi:hypothetical protein
MVVDDRRDRLVLPPGSSLGAWSARVTEVLRGTWRALVLVLLVTVTLPAVGVELAFSLVDPRRFAALWLAAAVLVAAAAVALAWSASAFVITRWAAALPRRPGSALRYAAWRFPRVAPWTLLVAVSVGLGLVLLVLPGLALILMWSMALPAASFERANPVLRSWRLVRSAMRSVTARTVILVGAALAWTAAARAVGYAVAAGDGWPRVLATAGVTWVLSLPAVAVVFAGTMITYAERRGGELPVRAVTLAGELESPRLIVSEPSTRS